MMMMMTNFANDENLTLLENEKSENIHAKNDYHEKVIMCVWAWKKQEITKKSN